MNNSLKVKTKRDEIFNSVTHGVGIAIAIAITVLLVVRAAIQGNIWHIVSFSIFGIGSIIVYTSSTIFHAIYTPRLKHKWNKLDHSAIYILIAATYTPITLVTLKGGIGWVIFGIVWVMAIAGVIFKLFFYTAKLRKLSTVLYLIMGWVIIAAIVPVIKNTPAPTLWFLLAGCLSYSMGPVFYLWRSKPYMHGIFHLFVLGGTICHFFGFWNLV